MPHTYEEFFETERDAVSSVVTECIFLPCCRPGGDESSSDEDSDDDYFSSSDEESESEDGFDDSVCPIGCDQVWLSNPIRLWSSVLSARAWFRIA